MTTRMPFVGELALLREDILAMSSMVAENLGRAVEALRSGDRALAEKARESDREVYRMQEKIQDRAAVLIATQQPVAADMRELVASIRLADNLERMGDYAAHLAKAAARLDASRWERHLDALAAMGDLGLSMIRSMAQAFLARDPQAARDCAERDEDMDRMHHSLMDLTVQSLRDDPQDAGEVMRIIRTSTFMERLGDRVTNGCELALYVATGMHAEFHG